MSKEKIKPGQKIKTELMIKVFIVHCSLLVAFSGCSSAPKRPAENFTGRNIAVSQLNLADHAANQGHYEDALLLLEEARRLALATDDPSLRIKTSVNKGNYLFSLGRHDEAFREWENAAREADASGEQVLAALARIYSIRASIVLLATDASAEDLLRRLDRETAAVKSDQLADAAALVTRSLAEKHLKRWTQAESTAKQALAIHEKNLYLEDAAYDWFLIASIRSVAGNYNTAVEALNEAIRLDRRAENSFGLASSWQALGEVYQKAGRTADSGSAYIRAAEIFRAIGHGDRAEKLEELAK